MAAIGRPPLLRPGWIVYSLFVLYPLFWLMGFAEFVWAISVVPLAVWAMLQGRLSRPPTVTLFAIYVLWAGFTVVRLDRLTRVLAFGMRYATYVAALGLAYYVYNERRVSRATFVNWVAMLWVWSILGGYLGLLFPHVRLSVTPASLLLPRALLADDYVAFMVRPRLAQVQDIFGLPIPRPSALYAYTNSWGAAVGLLTPFFAAATLFAADQRRRRFGTFGLLLALPPALLSVNRGLWLSLGLVLTVVAVRSFLAGRRGPLKVAAAAIVVIGGLIALTPIGETVGGRLEESSASTRAGIYREAWAGAKESPILGWGGPRPSTNPFSPHVGSHGHVWFAMFSHGLVGLALYLVWMVWAIYAVSTRRDPVSIMLGSVVFVAALQMFFYNMFSAPLPIILIAIALTFRDDADHEGARPRQTGSAALQVSTSR